MTNRFSALVVFGAVTVLSRYVDASPPARIMVDKKFVDDRLILFQNQLHPVESSDPQFPLVIRELHDLDTIVNEGQTAASIQQGKLVFTRQSVQQMLEVYRAQLLQITNHPSDVVQRAQLVAREIDDMAKLLFETPEVPNDAATVVDNTPPPVRIRVDKKFVDDRLILFQNQLRPVESSDPEIRLVIRELRDLDTTLNEGQTAASIKQGKLVFTRQSVQQMLGVYEAQLRRIESTSSSVVQRAQLVAREIDDMAKLLFEAPTEPANLTH
jgi:hypothetical protein